MYVLLPLTVLPLDGGVTVGTVGIYGADGMVGIYTGAVVVDRTTAPRREMSLRYFVAGRLDFFKLVGFGI